MAHALNAAPGVCGGSTDSFDDCRMYRELVRPAAEEN